MPFFSKIVQGEVFQPRKKIVVFGNGGHARTAYGYFFDDQALAGFVVDDDYVKDRPQIGSMDVVPTSKMQALFPPDEYALLMAIGYQDLNEFRRQKSSEMRALGYDFVSFVDRSVRVPSDYSIQTNTLVLGHADIHEGACIGEGVFVSSGAVLGHDTILEDYAWIGTGAVLAGGVRVGACSFLSMNVSVKQHAQLAHHTLVSPNSYVNMDTAAYASVVAGKAVPIDSRKLLRFSESADAKARA